MVAAAADGVKPRLPGVQHRVRSRLGRANMFALVAITLAPYQLLLASLFPIKTVGGSLMAAVVPSGVLMAATLSVRRSIRRETLQAVLLLGGGLAVVIALKRLLGISKVTRSEIQTFRFVILIPLWLRVTRATMADARTRRLALNLIVINGAIAAVSGIAYRYGLLHIQIARDETGAILPFFLTRASGFFISPNLYASMVVVSALLIALIILPRSTLRGVALLALAAAGVFTSASRWALIAIVLLTLASFIVQSGRVRSATSLALPLRYLLLAVAIIALGPAAVASVASRFTEVGGNSRVAKTKVGLAALTKGVDTLTVGGRAEDQSSGDTRDPRKTFSDNGWLAMPLSVGLPLALGLIVNSWFVVHPRGRKLPWRAWLVLIVFGGTMLINNAFLWDPWMLWTSAVFWIVYYESVSRSASI